MLILLKQLLVLTSFFPMLTGMWEDGMEQLKGLNDQECISDPISDAKLKEAAHLAAPKPAVKKIKASLKPKKKKKRRSSRRGFSQIDRYAKSAPSSAEVDIQSLANYLQKGANSDLEKARAIYTWITDNVRYDDHVYNTGVFDDNRAEAALAGRRAVCSGFANLYVALGRAMGLEIERVVGYSKGYGYVTGTRFQKPDHAWNVIKINGSWRIFDATWGQGYGNNVNGQLVSKKDFDGYWFNVDPYEAIFNHLPRESRHAFVQPVVSLYEFEQLPNIDGEYFALGFNGRETYRKSISGKGPELPETYPTTVKAEAISAPKSKYLKRNQSYNFEFDVPGGVRVAVIDSNNKWVFFKKKNNKFVLNYVPQQGGELSININHNKSGKGFETLLVYTVVDGKLTSI